MSEGADPISARRAVVVAAAKDRASQKTFADVAEQYIAQHRKAWKNEKHGAQWTSTLKTYAEPIIGSMPVREVASVDVIRVLEPIWASKTETATRVRSRMELVLDFAAARGLRDGPNPARWRGNLDAAFPQASKVAKVRHHAALEVGRVGAFMSSLRAQSGIAARASIVSLCPSRRSSCCVHCPVERPTSSCFLACAARFRT